MTQRRVRARTGSAARRKANTKGVTVTRVNYIKGSKGKGGKGSYAVTTKRKK